MVAPAQRGTRVPAISADATGEAHLTDESDLGLHLCREALRLIKTINERMGLAEGLRRQGYAHLLRGDTDLARGCLCDALAVSLVVGDPEGEGWAHCGLGELALASGELRDARALLLEAMGGFRTADVAFGVYTVHIVLAEVARAAGHWGDAARNLEQAVTSQHVHQYSARYSEVLEGLAAVAGRVHEGQSAGRLCGAAAHWRFTFDEVEVVPYHRQAHARTAWQIRQRLGEQAWRATYLQGQQLAPDQVTDLAGDVATRLSCLLAAAPAGLTQREVEVLRQVALGLDSIAVAGRLAISPRTVHAHLRSIFDKLGVATRTAAAREAVRLNLT
jgi:DNA-binding CsgD family transcriptional regulator